jgi:hypothetical protein
MTDTLLQLTRQDPASTWAVNAYEIALHGGTMAHSANLLGRQYNRRHNEFFNHHNYAGQAADRDR